MIDEMKAREAAVQALWREVGEFDEVTPKEVYLANAAIDAYLAALSPLPDEQLDEIERKANEVLNPDPDFWGKLAHESLSRRSFAVTAAVPVLVAEVRRLRALSSHPDEETVTSEPDVTWPADLRESSRARASRELIREANAVRDLDGTGIVGRLADMLAGWLSARPTHEGSETA